MNYDFLNDRFDYNETIGTYTSKRKWIGSGTGDDSTLYIDVSGNTTLLWWRQNRGYEMTIFDGRKLNTPEEFEMVFDLLDITTLLKWNKMVEIEVNKKPSPADFKDYSDYVHAYCAWERKTNPQYNSDKPEKFTVPYIKSEKDQQIKRMEALGINTTGQMFEQMVSSMLLILENRKYMIKKEVKESICSCGRGPRLDGEHYCEKCLKHNPLLRV